MIASAKRTTHATDALDESQTRLLLGAEWPPRSREMMIVRRQIRRTFLATGGTSDALARLDKANLNGLKETPRSEGRCSSSCAPKKPGGDGAAGLFLPVTCLSGAPASACPARGPSASASRPGSRVRR